MTPEKRPAEEEEEAEQQASKKLKEEEVEKADDSNGAATSDTIKPDEEESKDETTTEESNGANTKPRKFPEEQCGTMVFSGCSQWDYIGRRNTKGIANLTHFVPKIVKSMKGIEVAFVASHCTAAHSVIITADGTAMTMGRNEKAQLGLGDCEPRPGGPTAVKDLAGEVIIDAAVGKNHTLFLTEAKELYACGDNKSGQCGVGKQNNVIHVPTKVNFKEGPVKKISCGAEFSVLVDSRGYLYSFGSPEYGQLGHNTDGKYFVTSNKLTFQFEMSPRRVPVFIERSKDGHATPVTDVQIMEVACGQNHTVCVDKHKRAYSWGFGGYGRLGHADNKDEMIPRQIKFFEGNKRGITKVFCGGAYTIGISELGTYLWGQTKRTGEANMYPKPLQDLYGWSIRSIGTSGTSIVVAADTSVIAWGPSPTYGELGLGENVKSTTTPKEVKALDGAHACQVSCGQGHTIFILKDKTEKDNVVLNKLKTADM